MNPNKLFTPLLCLLLSACTTPKKITATKTTAVHPLETTTKSLDFYDSSRHRSIPMTFYVPANDEASAGEKIVIFSHGYGENKEGSNKSYSYLTEALASRGYFVASIQHELPDDPLLPMTGNIQETRKPNWERGVVNILFVLNELKRLRPDLDYSHLTLMGHSNGADMSMLFATQYSELVDKVVALDNRRVPIPRLAKPRIYSLRSSDQPADKGVLPTPAEQKTYGMKIIKLPHTLHNNMGNNGSKAEKAEMVRYVLGFMDM